MLYGTIKGTRAVFEPACELVFVKKEKQHGKAEGQEENRTK